MQRQQDLHTSWYPACRACIHACLQHLDLHSHSPHASPHPQLFDGKDGRPKYPKRWIMLPPFF